MRRKEENVSVANGVKSKHILFTVWEYVHMEPVWPRRVPLCSFLVWLLDGSNFKVTAL